MKTIGYYEVLFGSQFADLLGWLKRRSGTWIFPNLPSMTNERVGESVIRLSVFREPPNGNSISQNLHLGLIIISWNYWHRAKGDPCWIVFIFAISEWCNYWTISCNTQVFLVYQLYETLKTNNMSNLLYFIAVILIIFWLLGYFVYDLGAIIHILLVLAIISVLFRVIQGSGSTK